MDSVITIGILVVITLLMVIKGVIEIRERKITTKDIQDFKEWLVYAVSVAQKELGKDTGELKLYKVWDMATEKAPWICNFISFDQFKQWVVDAKEDLLTLAEDNEKIMEFLYGVIPEKSLNDGE